MNVLLAKTDHLTKSFREGIKDYISYFKNKQTQFKGEKKTYEAAAGTIDLPSERGNTLVVTTVDEKLDWFTVTHREYIDALFSQEATNAAGLCKAELVVAGQSWGIFTALELLRLKSLVDNGDVAMMYSEIPVRNDAEEWTRSGNDMYKDREIFEGVKMGGDKKTTEKENIILVDPNIQNLKEGNNYIPVMGIKTTVLTLGTMSHQKFSGEWSHKQRAELLRRKTILLNAVIEALKVANDVEAIKSELTAEKLFGYIHYGKS